MFNISDPIVSRWLLVLICLGAAGLAGCDEGEPSADGNAVRLELAVQGMHCDGCAQALTNKLIKLPGVIGCEASFEKKQAVVLLEPKAATTRDELVTAIEALGYTVGAEAPVPPPGEQP